MTYDPQVKDASEFKTVRQDKPDAPDLVRCFEQAEPARKLPHLADIPILILTSESSYHAPYDHCTAKWLAQAGVKNDFIRLVDHGIRGNGHMMMLEKNNLEISAFIRGWEQTHVH
jgi:pimeloyl-ACP methyl ester carboxylesterase